jgi:hypothetical protein
MAKNLSTTTVEAQNIAPLCLVFVGSGYRAHGQALPQMHRLKKMGNGLVYPANI